MAYPLAIALQSSPGLLAPVLAAHAAVGLALYHSGLGSWTLGGCGLLVLVSGLSAVVSEWRKRGLVLILHEDGGASLQRTGLAPCVARIGPGAVVFSGVIWFRLELLEAERWRRRHLRMMLVAGNVQAGQWRAFRVWLRHRALRLAAVSA